ncbi:hypothetical protein GCM10007877_14470 [Marinibactrum halimedae]|uniref:Uncharacterized protein n=2 Tax=Marinibactrum halimedae TaxID=1444977 RepID=A0AA37T3C2_9GAMM|nr:hypothetical protein GCM10007877_14470 [Marinibactrum halimedae]
MMPTGYEYTFLSDKTIQFVLRALLKQLQLNWGQVFVEVSPDWKRYEFESWVENVDLLPKDFELYFVSDKAGFDHIEENGITKNVDGIKFFLLEVKGPSPLGYNIKVSGGVDKDNINFGEFECELIAKILNEYTVIVPEQSENSSGDIVCMVRDILKE